MNRLSRFAITLCAAACTAGTSSSGGPKPDRVEPPEMVSRGPAPELRVPPTVSGRASVRVTIEVLIDSTGQPDMTTFKATGLGAEENRDALYRWIEQGMYRPARRGGQPIAAVYKTGLLARVEVR